MLSAEIFTQSAKRYTTLYLKPSYNELYYNELCYNKLSYNELSYNKLSYKEVPVYLGSKLYLFWSNDYTTRYIKCNEDDWVLYIPFNII